MPEAPVPAIVLQNRGVPVKLYRLENGALPPIEDEDAERPTRVVHLRFTANHVAQIEDAFDGISREVEVRVQEPVMVDGKPLIHPEGPDGPEGPLTVERYMGREVRNYYGAEAFSVALETKMVRTLRTVFSIAFEVPEEEMGLAMLPGLVLEYQNAVGVAWSIAQGVDPTDAAKVLAKAAAGIAEARANLASELQKTMAEDEDGTDASPGPTGPPPGSPQDGA